MGSANNKGADQPAHPRSLISALVIRFLESIISKLATGEISIFYLVSVAVNIDLNIALSETPKTGFVASRPNYYSTTVVPTNSGSDEMFCLQLLSKTLTCTLHLS